MPNRRPAASEHAPFFARYVERVRGSDVLAFLGEQERTLGELFESVSEEGSLHRYAPGKWSVKDLAQHLADSERVFSYRALRFARGDTTPLPGFDQNPYADAAMADRRPIAALADELRALRQATLSLAHSLDEATLDRSGVASESPVTVRALLWIIAGHERHHMKVLRERYRVGTD